MIDFDEELKKYQPILEIDQVEDSVHTDEIEDIIDMVKHIVKK